MAIVKYERQAGDKLGGRVRANLKAVAAIGDRDIDTSDLTELTEADFARAMPNPYYRPVKKAISARLDADVIAWLKSKGQGYQTRMNLLLRKAMLEDVESRRRAGSR